MKSLEKYIGNFGRYQARLYALAVPIFVTSGAVLMTFPLSAGVPRLRCFIPGVDDVSFDSYIDENTEIKNNITNAMYDNPIIANHYPSFYAAPEQFSGKQIYCRLCVDYNETLEVLKIANKRIYRNETVNQTETDFCSKTNSIPCPHGYIYDHSQFETSLVADLHMACDGAWMRSTYSSFFMVGYLVGSIICGTLSDKFGRRPILRALVIGGLFTYHGIAFVSNFPLLCLFNFLNGYISLSASIVAYTVIMEYISGMPATILGVMIQGGISVGIAYIGVVGFFIRERTLMTIVGTLVSVTCIPCFLWFPESVRWLAVRGRSSEAKSIILKAAQMNNRVVTVDEIEINMGVLGCGIENTLLSVDKSVAVEPVTKNETVIDLLFTNIHLTKMCLIVFFSWFTCTITYYGLALNTGDLPGNFYVNIIVSGLIELPGFMIVIPAMHYIGRKPTISFFFGLTGVCILVSTFLPDTVWLLKTILAQIGRMDAATAFAIVYNYSAELFPTVARNAALGLSSSCARIASIGAPQIYYLGNVINAPWLPFTVYGGTAVLASILVLGLPETKQRKLPDTIADAVHLAKGLSKPIEYELS